MLRMRRRRKVRNVAMTSLRAVSVQERGVMGEGWEIGTRERQSSNMDV